MLDTRPRRCSGADICSMLMLLVVCTISAPPPIAANTTAMVKLGASARPAMAAHSVNAAMNCTRPWCS